MAADPAGLIHAALVNEFARQLHYPGGVDFDALTGVVLAAVEPAVLPPVRSRTLWDIFAEAAEADD